ncbi:MAG: tandem-95 repeat protein [Candidatus Cloacimonetes bacterium]|nr:tandem-95 repeat protein [Candidatus Cloacimonadota bacterium]
MMIQRKLLILGLFICSICLIFADPPELYLLTEQIFEEDGELVVDFVADSLVIDNDGDELLITIVNNEHILAEEAGSVVSFTAVANWNGSETISFFADDQNGGYVQGELDFTVLPVNDPPVINLPATFSFMEGEILAVDLNNYVTEVDGDALNLAFYGNENIMINIVGGLVITLMAVESWIGEEMGYFIVDDGMMTATDSVMIVVTAGTWNHAPEFVDLPEELTFPEDTPFQLDLGPYIFDVDEEDEFVITVNNNLNIQCQVTGLVVSLSADPDWFGSETLLLTVYDTQPGGMRAHDEANIDVNVTPVNDAPEIALPDNFTLDEGEELYISFADYISDVDDDELELSFSGNENVWIEILAENIVYIYAPDWVTDDDTDWIGTEMVTFTVTDESGASASDDVEIVVEPGINHAPRLYLPYEFYMDEDTELIVDVNNLVYDDDGDDLVLVCDYPENITVLIDSLHVTFIPDPNWFGSETITFTVYDTCGERLSCTDTTIISVYPVNDAPVINLPDNFTLDEGEELYISFADYISDVDDDELELSFSGNENVWIEILAENVVYIYAPDWFTDDDTDWIGTEVVTFTVIDDSLACASDVVEIIVEPGINHAPRLNLPEEFYLDEDTELIVDFNNMVYDDDGDDLVLVCDYPENITVMIDSLHVTFIPDPNWFGTETVTFTVYDTCGERLSDTDTTIISVYPVNDAPVIDLPARLAFIGEEVFTANFGDCLYDIDDDILELTCSGNDHIEISITGYVVMMEAEPGFYGTEMVDFTVIDSQGATASDSVEIQVFPGSGNHPPEMELPENVSIMEDSLFQEDFSLYVFDPDDDELVLTAEDVPNIEIIIEELEVTIIPDSNWYGVTDITFIVFDICSRAFASDVLTLEVCPQNDLPTINLPEQFLFEENGTLTIDFSQFVEDVDMDELLIACITAENIIVNIQDLIVTFSATENWIGTEEIFFYVNDCQTRPEYMDSTIVIVNETWEHRYGDIDDNGAVESFDAALILQYAVGINPEPAAPLPWEEWRIAAADVSGDLEIGAYDGALVLQYYVGIINAFPVETVREFEMYPDADIAVRQENGVLEFSGSGELYSLEIELAEEIRDIVIDENLLCVTNGNKLALASAYPVNGHFLSIPAGRNYDNLTFIINEQYYEVVLNEGVEPVPTLAVYPNPFNPITNISYEVAESGSVLLRIYNLKGQRVETLLDNEVEAGRHNISWNAEGLSSGTYFLYYKTQSFEEVKKVVLLK